VDRDLVPGGGDLGRNRRPALDLLTDEEERRCRPGCFEQLKNGRRRLRMRTIVECQRDSRVAADSHGDPKSFRH
jgi:hypothetical protein